MISRFCIENSFKESREIVRMLMKLLCFINGEWADHGEQLGVRFLCSCFRLVHEGDCAFQFFQPPKNYSAKLADLRNKWFISAGIDLDTSPFTPDQVEEYSEGKSSIPSWPRTSISY